MLQSTKKKWVQVLAVSLTLSMVLFGFTACGGSSKSDTSKTRDDLVFATANEPNSLDPMAIANMSTFTITYAIYDNLVEENSDGEYVPSLAKKVDISKDGLTYTFTLNKGVKFHDGSEMTADDVVFSINRTIKKGWAFDMTAFIKSVKKVDDYTVKMTLNRPFDGMLGSLASPFFSIMSKSYLQKNGDTSVERKPMGTGAYKFVSWKSGDNITLEANEDYFKGAPSIKKVVFKPITDKDTGLVALQNGEIDAFLNINNSDIQTVKDDSNLAFYSTNQTAVLSLIMNTEVKPLNNEKVRQAINYAINKDDIIQGALEGVGTAANSAIAPTCSGYSKDVTGYSFSTDKAKALLKEAGYKSINLKIKLKEDSKNQKVAQIIQSNLKQVGINVEIETMEAGAYSNDVYVNGNYDMTITSWFAMFPDAYSLLYSQFHKDCYGSTGNITHVRDNTLSADLDAAAEASGDAKIAAYNKVAQYLNDHAYVAPLVYENTTITTNAKLKGVEANPLGVYKVKNFSWK